VVLGIAPCDARARAHAAGSGSWIVVGGQASLAHDVANALRAAGSAADVIAPGADFDAAAASGIVLCAPAARDGDEAAAARAALESCTALVRRASEDGAHTRLFTITCDAQAVHDGDGRDVASAALWGLGRVIANEHPEWRPTLVDVAGLGPRAGAQVARELLRGDADDEVALRGDGRYVRRWSRVAAEAVAPSSGPVDSCDVPRGHVAIAVEAIGIADVAVPVWEVTGRIEAIGDDVDASVLGSDVIAFAAERPGRRVVVARSRVVSRPRSVDATRAVAGTAAITAVETLLRVHAELAPGAVVWIHG